jgi:hypothetical protein
LWYQRRVRVIPHLLVEDAYCFLLARPGNRREIKRAVMHMQ